MSMRQYASLKERSVTLIINALIAYAVFFASAGTWLPSGGIESVWLISAISLWFLTLLSAPWFVPPRDAIVSGVGALLVLTTMDLGSVNRFQAELGTMRWLFVGFSVVVILVAVIALFLFDKDNRSVLGKYAFRITGIFGQGELLFSAPAVISIIGAYQAAFTEIAWLLLYWMLIAVGKPVERLAAAWRQIGEDADAAERNPTVGLIGRIDHPNIIRVKLSSANSWSPNRLFTASMPDGSQNYVVSLFSQMQGTEVVGTGLCVARAADQIDLASGAVCSSHDEEKTRGFLENLSGARDARLVGFVVENSNIGVIAFEVAVGADLKEGDVVFAHMAQSDVFYQIVGAETVEESFDQNPRGTHVVRAAQLGIYSPADGFTKFSWLPTMNTPLFSAGSRQFEPSVIGEREFAIGKIPSTEVEAVARLDDLVEFHTAILGVTGTGKTELALDLVRQAAQSNVKVFCVDFTGDYRQRLEDLNPIFPSPDATKASNIEGLLATIDAYGFKAGDQKTKLKELLNEIRGETATSINEFLSSDNQYVAIFELAEIANSKAGLRLTEIYLSAIMNWARKYRRARQIFICLEEAHTIVPEAFGSGFDGETKWVVERIGQIALQGRKYGVGLLVISQRTALVSKTILSQCNTFLTHSLIDQTSLNFLESVYSAQHTRLIPNLGRFEFLAFGKAIKAERPVILRRDFDQAKLDASLALRRPLPEDTPQATAAVEAAAEGD